jgi:hypothetical protein
LRICGGAAFLTGLPLLVGARQRRRRDIGHALLLALRGRRRKRLGLHAAGRRYRLPLLRLLLLRKRRPRCEQVFPRIALLRLERTGAEHCYKRDDDGKKAHSGAIKNEAVNPPLQGSRSLT